MKLKMPGGLTSIGGILLATNVFSETEGGHEVLAHRGLGLVQGR